MGYGGNSSGPFSQEHFQCRRPERCTNADGHLRGCRIILLLQELGALHAAGSTGDVAAARGRPQQLRRGSGGYGTCWLSRTHDEEAGIVQERNCSTLLKVADGNRRNSCTRNASIIEGVVRQNLLGFMFDFAKRAGQHSCLEWERECDVGAARCEVLRKRARRDNALTIRRSRNERCDNPGKGELV